MLLLCTAYIYTDVCHLIIAVSVRCLSWFNEEKRFAVGYSDGQVWLARKDNYSSSPEIRINAHEVCDRYAHTVVECRIRHVQHVCCRVADGLLASVYCSRVCILMVSWVEFLKLCKSVTDCAWISNGAMTKSVCYGLLYHREGNNEELSSCTYP